MLENIGTDIKPFSIEAQKFLQDLDSEDKFYLRKKSIDAGFYRLGPPVHLGGCGSGPLKHGVALETIAASGIRDPSYIIGSDSGILSVCTGELRERYLLPMLSGGKRVAFGLHGTKK